MILGQLRTGARSTTYAALSVTHFAFENIAISKVHAAQDGGDQDGEGQGQVRSMMLCFNVFSQRLFN